MSVKLQQQVKLTNAAAAAAMLWIHRPHVQTVVKITVHQEVTASGLH